ncbi:hypothetical protein MP228_005328 [Amoeboaphelidium protococcarum]|nr:hypothetical protein MP228_005328 [Amoeboaphelidium protococcarum]
MVQNSFGKLVSVKTCAETAQRYLVAEQSFTAGQVILRERAALTSLPQRDPDERRRVDTIVQTLYDVTELERDTLRLVVNWILSSTYGDHDAETALNTLSTDGVESHVAKSEDPDVEPFLSIQSDIIASILNKEPFKFSQVTASTIKKILMIVETNCHSRRLSDVAGSELIELYSTSEYNVEEELIAVGIVSSMMQHSCIPNGDVDLEYNEDDDRVYIVLRSLTAIEPEEELTISYHDMEFQLFEDRQIACRRKGFNCQCDLCASRVIDPANLELCELCGYLSVLNRASSIVQCLQCKVQYEKSNLALLSPVSIEMNSLIIELDRINGQSITGDDDALHFDVLNTVRSVTQAKIPSQSVNMAQFVCLPWYQYINEMLYFDHSLLSQGDFTIDQSRINSIGVQKKQLYVKFLLCVWLCCCSQFYRSLTLIKYSDIVNLNSVLQLPMRKDQILAADLNHHLEQLQLLVAQSSPQVQQWCQQFVSSF